MSVPNILHVHVVPKSSKNEILGWVRDAAGNRWLKIRVAAPPEDGKANKELVKFLSRSLKLSQKQVEICGGAASRYKKIKIDDEAAIAALDLPEIA